MDPDVNLIALRALAHRVQAELDAVPDDTAPTTDQLIEWTSDLQRLSELVLALDGWLAGGGFLPRRWQKGADHPDGGRQ